MVGAALTPRAQVRVVFAAGIDIEHARADRIEIVDGDLQVRRAGRSPTIVASAADVTDVVWLDGRATAKIFEPSWWGRLARLNRATAPLLRAHDAPVWLASGSCVVVTERGPVAAWLVDDVAPGAGDASEKRTSSGSVALARALGVTLEAQTQDHSTSGRAVRRVTLRATGEREWLSRFSLWGALLALVLAAVSFGGLDGEPVAPISSAATVLAVALAVLSVRMRRRMLSLVDHPPAPADRSVHPSSSSRTQIQLGRDDIVLVPGDGTEYWLPGPDISGGITEIQVVDDYLHFKNSRQETIRLHPAAHLVVDEASCASLRAVAERAGVTVDVLIPPTADHQPVQVSELARHGWTAGDVTVVQSWLLWPLAPLLFVAGAATAQDVQRLGLVIQISAAFVLGCRIWSTWTLRRWISKTERGDAP